MAWPSTLARTKNWGTEILTDADLEGQFDLVIDYINDALSSTTGHKHDATSSEGPKILTANIDDAAGTQGDIIVSTGSALSRLAVGTAGQIVKSDGTDPSWGTMTHAELPDGAVVNMVNTIDGTVSTHTTAIPSDASIPQITEGEEVMTLAITPKATTNIIRVDVVAIVGHDATGAKLAASLFNTDFHATNAAATGGADNLGNNSAMHTISFTYWCLASDLNGTTATTFRVRVGAQDGTTTTWNGVGGANLYGATEKSSITITEIKAS